MMSIPPLIPSVSSPRGANGGIPLAMGAFPNGGIPNHEVMYTNGVPNQEVMYTNGGFPNGGISTIEEQHQNFNSSGILKHQEVSHNAEYSGGILEFHKQQNNWGIPIFHNKTMHFQEPYHKVGVQYTQQHQVNNMHEQSQDTQDIFIPIPSLKQRNNDDFDYELLPKKRFQCLSWSENFNPAKVEFDKRIVKRIGSIYTIVNEDTNDVKSVEIEDSSILPGTVSCDLNDYRKNFENIEIKNGIFNARMQLYASNQDKMFHTKCFEVKILVKKFIEKLKHALRKEHEFLLSVRSQNNLRPPQNIHKHLQLPRFGKVYAEFIKCMRAWNEVVRLWNIDKSHFTSQMIHKLSKLISNDVIFAQDRMLQLTKSLILMHCQNIGEFAALLTSNRIDNFEVYFLPSDIKRFCKLIEVFNRYVALSPKAISLRNHFCKLHVECQTNFLNNSVLNSIQSVNIQDILTSLALPVAKNLAIVFSSIFSEYITHVPESQPKFEWADLLKMKIRPIKLSDSEDLENSQQINIANIVKVMGPVKIPFPNSLFNTEENTVSLFFRYQKQFLISFFSTFASSSSLLRKTLLSHNSQVMRLTPSPIDDTVSVLSSEDGSSFQYASFRKTVMWRDSWDMDSVMSVSNRCLQSIAQYLPQILSHYSQLSDFTKQIGCDSLDIPLPAKCYWYDQATACFEVCVFNLSNLQMFPDMIIKNINEAMGELVLDSAGALGDNLLCEAQANLYLARPREYPNHLQLEGTTYVHLQAIHTLLVMLTKYKSYFEVVNEILPKLEVVLNSAYTWVTKRIDVYLSKCQIQPLLKMCLRDLRDITENSLDCLQQIEACHNCVETRRSNNSANLHVATQHLKNIDGIITNYQELSANCLKRYSNLINKYCDELINQLFPKTKLWVTKSAKTPECANEYINEIISNFFEPSYNAVQEMDLQSQMSVIPCVANCVFGRVLNYIEKIKIKFTVEGANQLKVDLECLYDYFFSEDFNVLPEVQSTLQMLCHVKQSFHVVNLLLSTDCDEVNQSSVSLSTSDAHESKQNDKFWLSLRSKSGANFAKRKWKSTLPCLN